MLDQNTDRMWYVIGAIVIGGLILTSSIVLFTDVAFARTSSSMYGLISIYEDEPINLYSESKVIKSGIYGYWWDSDDNDRTLSTTLGSNTRSFYWQVKPGERYQVTRSDKRNTRFGIGFAKVEPINQGDTLYHVSNEFQNELEMEFVVPDDMEYAYLYLYQSNATSDDLPDIGIYKVVDN